MTYSIVAHDPDSGAFGVATATGGPCVGALVPHALSGVGAIATQGDTNPHYGFDGLMLLRGGASAEGVVQTMTAADAGKARRQLIVIGGGGSPAAFSGAEIEPAAGSFIGDGFAVAGNMLRSDDVLEAMAGGYESADGRRFEDRLLAAVQAGEAAGGDRRGTRSAAMLICSSRAYPDIDCRIDLSDDPIAALAALIEVCRAGGYRDFLASRPRRGLRQATDSS